MLLRPILLGAWFLLCIAAHVAVMLITITHSAVQGRATAVLYILLTATVLTNGISALKSHPYRSFLLVLGFTALPVAVILGLAALGNAQGIFILCYVWELIFYNPVCP
jgi:hypothetical protein